MTLRLEQIIADIQKMSGSFDTSDRRAWLEEARRLLRTHDRQLLIEKLEPYWQPPYTILAPEPLGDLDERISAPNAPTTYTVVAADGSNIAPDPDNVVRFYLLNIGLVTLCYGETPKADISAKAELKFEFDDLYWDQQRKRPVNGERLSLLMRIREIEILAELVEQVTYPCVMLVDGQLIMWALQKEHKDDQEWLMGRLTRAFNRLQEYGIPIVGYISGTNSFELVNALRIYLCPTAPNECQHCHEKGPEELALCYHLNGFRDPALLFDFLEPGERSCTFASYASILKEYNEDHRIVYFYMSTGDEVVRVEIPKWVADKPKLLDLVHAVLHDQCSRSGQQPPYPPALHESHEAAVISTGDREAVQMLIEEQLQRRGITTFSPAKSYHKRLRGV